MQLYLVSLLSLKERNMCHERDGVSLDHDLTKPCSKCKFKTALSFGLAINWVGVHTTVPIYVGFDLVIYKTIDHL